jgi:D-alanine-D-alanine ligase-like ATP-grasp enzyme
MHIIKEHIMDYMLDPPDEEFYDFEEDYVDGDEDYDYDDYLTEQDIGDYRSDEYERTINQNY